MLIVQAPVPVLPIPAARLPPPPRSDELDLGLPEERRIEAVIEAPEGWRPESLPKAAHRESPWFALDCAWDAQPAGYAMRGAGRQLVSSVTPEQYAAFRDAAREAGTLQDEGVVLVRASAP
jgi:hypothetical protein